MSIELVSGSSVDVEEFTSFSGVRMCRSAN